MRSCQLSDCPGKLYQCGQEGGSSDSVEERHRHRYEVNPDHVADLEKAGMIFVGHSTDNTRMEIMELKGIIITPKKPVLLIRL